MCVQIILRAEAENHAGQDKDQDFDFFASENKPRHARMVLAGQDFVEPDARGNGASGISPYQALLA